MAKIRGGLTTWAEDSLAGASMSPATWTNSYLAILRTMDTWDPLRGQASAAEVFGRIRARLSFVGISSDWLFPPHAVRDFAYTIRAAGVQADYREMTSAHGHDAFLAEQAELVRLLQ